jgi:hypothetical protein
MRASGISNLSRHTGSVSGPIRPRVARRSHRNPPVLGREGVCPLGDEALDLAGVAQLVEHLFCKQVVRGSSPLAGSHASAQRTGTKQRSFCAPTRARLNLSPGLLEGCPSGQREQAVNLPDLSYVGSNPTPSTRPVRRSLSECSGSGSRFAGIAFGSFAPLKCSVLASDSAGVAQLVERQPSKLNVEGSSPFSRSQPRGVGLAGARGKMFTKSGLREWRSVQGSAALTSKSPT